MLTLLSHDRNNVFCSDVLLSKSKHFLPIICTEENNFYPNGRILTIYKLPLTDNIWTFPEEEYVEENEIKMLKEHLS